MTVEDLANVEIDRKTGSVSVYSCHSLQNKQHRVIGAVSVLFVIHDQSGSLEKDEQPSHYTQLGDNIHTDVKNVVPASLSVVEVPFGNNTSQFLADSQYSASSFIQFDHSSISHIARNVQESSCDVAASLHESESVISLKKPDLMETDRKSFSSQDSDSASEMFLQGQTVCEGNMEKGSNERITKFNCMKSTKGKLIKAHAGPKCFRCDQVLDTYDKVIAHCKIHNFQKKCPVCALEFRSTKNNLKRHFLSHLHRQLYPCPFEFCNSTFGRKDNLQKHVAKHEYRLGNPDLKNSSQLHRFRKYQCESMKRNRAKYCNMPTLVKIPSVLNNLKKEESAFIGQVKSGMPDVGDHFPDKTTKIDEKTINSSSTAQVNDHPGYKSIDVSTIISHVETPDGRDSSIIISPLPVPEDNTSLCHASNLNKKTSIDSVISRISQRAKLLNRTSPDLRNLEASDTSAESLKNFESSDFPIQEEKLPAMKDISDLSTEEPLYQSHEVVFPIRNDELRWNYSEGGDAHVDATLSEDCISMGTVSTLSPPRASSNMSESPGNMLQEQHVQSKWLEERSYFVEEKCGLNPVQVRCAFCDNMLNSCDTVMNHITDHTDFISHKLTCVVCKVQLSSKDCLRRHINRHFGVKFQCKFCSNSYSRKDNLKKHMRDVHRKTDILTGLRDPKHIQGDIVNQRKDKKNHVLEKTYYTH